MTLLVRDEVDIVAAVVEHHLAQGVDFIIATDNGSVDGTREVLERYQATGRLELHDYFVHDKKQAAIVSAMASRAYTVHHADWVINVDADEFFLPVERTITLRQAFEGIPKSIGSFTAPVVNMTGPAARTGSGIDRLIWRDVRPEESLFRAAGLHAHPTANAVHVGVADISVVQGNHFVNVPSTGQPALENQIEVLHLPWRSWRQFGTKVANAGSSYASNPKLRPSPRHHGMRDYRFLLAGALEESYIFRHPSPATLQREPDNGDLVADDWLAVRLAEMDSAKEALLPDELSAVLEDADPGLYTQHDWDRAAQVMNVILPLEIERTEALARAYGERDQWRRQADLTKKKVARLETRLATLDKQLTAMKASRAYRLGRRISVATTRVRKAIGK